MKNKKTFFIILYFIFYLLQLQIKGFVMKDSFFVLKLKLMQGGINIEEGLMQNLKGALYNDYITCSGVMLKIGGNHYDNKSINLDSEYLMQREYVTANINPKSKFILTTDDSGNFIIEDNKGCVLFDDIGISRPMLNQKEISPVAVHGDRIRVSLITGCAGDCKFCGLNKLKYCVNEFNVLKEEIDYFKSKNLVCKLMGFSRHYGSSISLYVCPVCLNGLMAHVGDNLNIASCTSQHLGKLEMIGQGAGGSPTATAVISDLLDLFENNTTPFLFHHSLDIDNSKELHHFYLRERIEDFHEELALSYEKDETYIYMKTKRMTLNELLSIVSSKDVFLALLEDKHENR